MNPALWLNDFVHDMASLHTAMIAIGALISAICFKIYIPSIAQNTDLAVKGFIRLTITVGLIVGFSQLQAITGTAFDEMANYINPEWNDSSDTFSKTLQKVMVQQNEKAPTTLNNRLSSSSYMGKMARDIADNIYAAIITACMTLLTLLAQVMLFFLGVAHRVILNVEYALIPAFLGFIAHPSSARIGWGFLTSFLGIQLWIPTFALVMRVNESLYRNVFLGAQAGGGELGAFGGPGGIDNLGISGPIAMLLLLGVFSIWTIFTLLSVPIFAKKMLAGTGIGGALMGTGFSGVLGVGSAAVNAGLGVGNVILKAATVSALTGGAGAPAALAGGASTSAASGGGETKAQPPLLSSVSSSQSEPSSVTTPQTPTGPQTPPSSPAAKRPWLNPNESMFSDENMERSRQQIFDKYIKKKL